MGSEPEVRESGSPGVSSVVFPELLRGGFQYFF